MLKLFGGLIDEYAILIDVLLYPAIGCQLTVVILILDDYMKHHETPLGNIKGYNYSKIL